MAEVGAILDSRRFTLAVLVLALALRVALIYNMGNTYHFADTGEYDTAARSILAGQGPSAGVPRAPLFPAEMALGFLFGGVGNYRAVRVIQLVLGMLIVVQVGRLGSRIGGTRVGRIAMLAAAVAPTLVFTTGLLYPTALYTLLLLSATIATWDLSRQPRLRTAVWLGVLLMLAWLTDQIVMVPAAFLLTWLLFALAPHGRRGFVVFAAVVLVAMASAGSWVRYNETHYGKSGFFFAKAQYVLHFARHDTTMNRLRAIREPGEFHALPMDSLIGREAHYLRNHPAGYLSDYAMEFVHYFDPWPDRLRTENSYTRRELLWIGAIYITPVLVFALLGLLFARVRTRDRLLLALVPLATAFIYSFFMTQTRYRIPSEPQMLVLAALGVARFLPGLASALSGIPGGVDAAPAASPKPSYP